MFIKIFYYIHLYYKIKAEVEKKPRKIRKIFTTYQKYVLEEHFIQKNKYPTKFELLQLSRILDLDEMTVKVSKTIV